MKKIVFKKDINSTKNSPSTSNVELTSFKNKEKQESDYTFTSETVLDALKNVMDPELPVSIVDLGLIYNVETADNNIDIKMSLTPPV